MDTSSEMHHVNDWALVFFFQFGDLRERVNVSRNFHSMDELKLTAYNFIISKIPEFSEVPELSSSLNLHLLLPQTIHPSENQSDNHHPNSESQSNFVPIDNIDLVTHHCLVDIVLPTDILSHFPQVHAQAVATEHNPNTTSTTTNALRRLVTSASCAISPTSGGGVFPGQMMTSSHEFEVVTYKTFHFCDYCNEFIWGLFKQGIKCVVCGVNLHKRCATLIPNRCRKPDSAMPPASHPVTSPHLTPSNETAVSNPPSPRHAAGGSWLASKQRRIVDNKRSGSVSDLVVVDEKTNTKTAGREDTTENGKQQQQRRSVPAITNGANEVSGLPHSFYVLKLNHNQSTSMGATSAAVSHAVSNSNATGNAMVVCDFCDKRIKTGSCLKCNDCTYICHFACESSVPACCCLPLTNYNVFESQMSAAVPVDNHHHEETRDSLAPLNRLHTRITPSSNGANGSNGVVQKQGIMCYFTPQSPGSRRRGVWIIDASHLSIYPPGVVPNSQTAPELSIAFQHVVEITRRQSGAMHHVPKGEFPCVFTVRAVGGTGLILYVGEDPTLMGRQPDAPDVERGIGHAYAKGWYEALRQVCYNLHDLTHDVKICEFYEIDEHPIGSGQFGTILSATDRLTKERVAIKKVDKQRHSAEEHQQKMRAEVKYLQSFSHPNIIRMYNCIENKDKIYLVMELLDGDMLDMVLKSPGSRLPERVVKVMVYQILCALKFLNSHQISHNDLKPENVLIVKRNEPFPQIKLCDFGFARVIGEKSFRRSIIGTPAYLPPEALPNQGGGEPRWNRGLDMWSVGVIVFVSLSGVFPYSHDKDISLQVRNASLMWPSNPWASLPQARDLARNLMQIEVKKRFTVQSALSHSWFGDYVFWCDLRALEHRISVENARANASSTTNGAVAMETDDALPSKIWWTSEADCAEMESKRVKEGLPHWKQIGCKLAPWISALTPSAYKNVAGEPPRRPLTWAALSNLQEHDDELEIEEF